HDDGGIVFLIIDGHPVHRSRAVKEFAASTKRKLRLFFLPPYSPELNPDEWVWKNVKHDRVGKTAITSFDDLRGKAAAKLKPRSCASNAYPNLSVRSSVTHASAASHSPASRSSYFRSP
ncbi:MAG: transposase, partial [Pseudonocardiaceae bacterium]